MLKKKILKKHVTAGDQAKLMRESSKANKKINLLQEEAIIVAANTKL